MTDYNKAFRLDGKVALVTGGARGIGAAVSEALAQAGASVLVTDVLEATETVASIRKAGGKAEFLKHDVTVEAQWEAAVAAAIAKFGSLSILVNNAGIETAALITQCTVEDFRRVMDVNVTGVFLGHKHAMRVMKPGSSIINLSSVAGIIGTTAHVAYHTSKGAVRLMTKAAAIECAQLGTGIRVNSVHPAIIGTDMGTNFIKHFVELGLAPDFAAAETAIKGLHPMGFGETRDVASAVIYLASDAAKFMNGSELVIDGGLTAA
ncbi:NAD(P)-dependent dehydrogenase (short-subunit alcohol dehydrogenase family) [Panacagrimonas perspica]|uniref:NAD(P)-dependent dehydrogenase (Short-subunit alcohol dehydrogenase family) n=1 Tax=Panacagrimonas perspica TaxID=381431 RepID=A0A4R7PH84_9GAMM|nr:SDR family oxidoreductase [Panacagrimonas perspica]TDU32780.1 NAD(P)-dependent dehydrogenase (short-subunit alcohol dehydrogenase family) [Panacagrimonas perspica]THD05657.1 dehydrogenase [Panacagrimonas perspica]